MLMGYSVRVHRLSVSDTHHGCWEEPQWEKGTAAFMPFLCGFLGATAGLSDPVGALPLFL